MLPSIFDAVCRAESWRSVLKILNSLSSCPKEAPVSAVLASSDGFDRTLAFADDHRLENAEQAIAVGGKVLQHIDGATRISKDRNEVDRGNLCPDKLLSGAECTQLIARRHCAHVEVECEQAAILVASQTHLGSGAIWVRARRL